MSEHATAILAARGVTKAFGALRALDDVDVSVRDGEFHGLIGPNGSGKTTLMKCIAGDLDPSAGTIEFGGRDITRRSPMTRSRQGISLKFQIASVVPALSVYDNILLSLQAHASLGALILSRTRRALARRATQLLHEFRLASRASDPAAALSHGEQQWLEIAMALAPSPRLLLLDEPTAGMSMEERRVTGDILRPLKGRCAVVIVEHDLDFIRGICDVLTVLDQGRVLGSGTVEQIQANKKIQEVYLRRA
jgi:branched-chain amino acid transport system ATP-binding protein/urea transport system ATP-binding protein